MSLYLFPYNLLKNGQRNPNGISVPMDAIKTISDLLGREAEKGAFSGAQAAWCRGSGAGVAVACAGTVRKAGGQAIDAQSLFDIASVTKLFTATATLALADQGRFSLDAPLAAALPGREDHPLATATARQLLAHEAGLRDWLPLFEAVPSDSRGTREAKEQIVALALASEPAAAPGAKTLYSDLGYIVLAHLLEQSTGQALDALVAAEVTGPLGLDSVRFRPVSGAPGEPSGIAATEACPWRGRILVGEAHDDNAWAMGGVSGHAGLFATASDVARLGAAWLDWLERGGLVSKALATEATTRRPGGRGLGWDFKSPQGSSAGERLGPRSFGHLGFTGCSLWVDPDRRLSVALHTNRVHLGRGNSALAALRPRFQDLLIESLEG